VIVAYVKNAYVQANSLEKYYAIAGDEFGEDKGKTALIVRALSGLKSSGASWRAHIAHTLSDIHGLFKSCTDLCTPVVNSSTSSKKILLS
jgi:fructose 1,6-bisphosphatase